MKIDLEELFEEIIPPRRSLIGLQFANDEDYERAKAVVRGDFELYHEIYDVWKMIVVRREDTVRFAEARLPYTEIEQIDPEELSAEERTRLDRAMIDSWKDILFARARQAR
ncbi:MAG TPA: hypothetical protein VII06_15845 [Chloroflexota bacterium]|jgi:hypothetical protein